jgi:predicted outer membrane repeat protein
MMPDCPAGSSSTMGTDFVLVPAGTFTLAGAAGEDMNASGDLDVTNLGDALFIDGVADAAGVPLTTIQAPPMDRILELRDPGAEPSEVTLQDVILQGGNPQGAGVDGGAINVNDDEAELEVIRSRIRNNTAPHYGGGIAFPNGSNDGPDFRIEGVEFSGNTAGDEGGGIYYQLEGTPTNYPLVIKRSAFVNNSAAETGGAVYVQANSSTDTLRAFNSTFSGNSAVNGGGAIAAGGAGVTAHVTFSTIAQNTSTAVGTAGGIQSDADNHAIFLLGTIIAGNSPANCAEVNPGDGVFVVTSEGYNIESADTCGLDTGGARVGLGLDLVNSDPLLAPLAVSTVAGAVQTTRTHGLYDTSPALNLIPRMPDDDWCAFSNTDNVDQRNVARPAAPNGMCDAGAFEGSVGPVPSGDGSSTPATPTTPAKKKCKKKKKKKRSASAAKKKKKKGCKKKKKK